METVKLLAFHLPQYHSFPENDKWWGKGFTDWVNVKKAQPLFDGHYQPRIPLDGYYNMLDVNTHIRQTRLAKEYGLYGFCYYHYWFNGKLLMEKPLELVLQNPKVDIPFCICWANEPWTRSWDGKSREIIMPQNYGDRKDWILHIEYLIQFFNDSRYIKVDNKPMLVIYRTNSIDNCQELIECWDKVCKLRGFDGIYIIEENNNFQNVAICDNSAATLDFEPGYTRSLDKTMAVKAKNKVAALFGKHYSTYSYETTCEHMIHRNFSNGYRRHYLGMFTGWDNTPRRSEGGVVAVGSTPEKFGKYLKIQKERSEQAGNEFLFINAWNEWAEGAYLEADNKYGYAYLEAIRNVTINIKE